MIEGLARRLPANLKVDAETWLVLYLRALALLFLINGLAHWLDILRLPDDPRGALLGLSFSERFETIAFAVLDPAAAVGLWLTASWGIVLWLIAALSRTVAASGLIGATEASFLTLAVQIVTVGIYLALAQIARSAAAQRE